MTLKELMARLVRFVSVQADNPELLKAQYRAFSKQLPLMYIILMSSTWSVAATHMGHTPIGLTVVVPVMLTVVSGVRLMYWWKSRGITPTAETARIALVRTNHLAILIAVVFTAWALVLFHHGNAYEKAQVAFYMAITVIGCIFSLSYLRSAAFIVSVIVNAAFIAFFVSSGEPTLVATAINMVFVSAALMVVISVNYRDFNRTIEAQIESRSREETQRRLLRMIDDMPVAVLTVDLATFNINYANETSKRTLRAIEHLIPVSPENIVGTSIDVFHQHPEHQRSLLADPANLPHRERIRLGPEVLDLQVSAVNDADGSYIGPMLSWSVVTRQVEAEEHIQRLAHYDPLTGLPNRTSFLRELEISVAQQSAVTGLLYIDLDDFKIINDVRGHLAGDELLSQVADRLRDACAATDGMLGRIGGDEFVLLLRDTDAEHAVSAAMKLIDALVAPYVLAQRRQVRIGASIGCALAPHHGEGAGELLARADMALYAAKAAGKGTFRMFSPEMEARARDRLSLETRLRVALEKGDELFVFYQPILDIRTKRVTTREALVRWHHPQRGWISPAEFIPVAEDSGLIDRLGHFVLGRACNDAVGWVDGARVAVNVSAAQLGRGTIVTIIEAALVESGLSPERLEIELTETALLRDEGEVVAELHALREIGVRVALDDFGTGFSSLSHVRVFKFDKIKIDGSFVRDAVERPDCAAVVRAIADIGARLGVVTVAEGVETPEQLARVTEEGCSEVQGYLFGRPAPGEQDVPAVERINRGSRERASNQTSARTGLSGEALSRS